MVIILYRKVQKRPYSTSHFALLYAPQVAMYTKWINSINIPYII